MQTPIQLIVGLGNPGAEYAKTRHNAGAWFVEQLAANSHQTLRPENKFHGLAGKINLDNSECRLLIPSTFMNHSGQALQAIMKFYQIDDAGSVLVAHDELDLPPGTSRFKLGGGHGGHNGLRDIIDHLHTKDFWRLRIGIGHPGNRNLVHDYVLSKPSVADHNAIDTSIEDALRVLPQFVKGDIDKAIQALHTANGNSNTTS